MSEEVVRNVGTEAVRDRGQEQPGESAQENTPRRWGRAAKTESGRNVGLPPVTIPTADFVSGATTGDRATFVEGLKNPLHPDKMLDVHQEGRDKDVTIEGETVQKCFTFLDTYTRTMAGSKDLEKVLQSKEGQADKMLMDKVCDLVKDANGNIIARTPNREKMEKFLQTSSGLAQTTLLLEEDQVWINMGLGADAIIKAQATRGQNNQEVGGKVALDRFFTLPGAGKVGTEKTLQAFGAIGVLFGTTGRSKLEFKEDKDLLRAMLNLPDSKKEYLKFRTGIDLKQIDSGTLTYKEEAAKPNVRALEARYANDVQLRKEIYIQLGIDKPSRFNGKVERNREIRMLHEFIMNPKAGRENLSVAHDQQVINTYLELNPRNTKGEQLATMADAFLQVRIDYAQKDVALEQSAEDREEQGNVIDLLRAKKQKFESDPTAFSAEERKTLEEKKKKATEGKEEVQKREKALLAGPDGITASESAVTKGEQALLGDLTLTGEKTLSEGAAEKITELKDAETEIRVKIETAEEGRETAINNYIADQYQKYIDMQENIAGSIASGVAPKKGGLTIPPFDASAFAPMIAAINKRFDTTIESLTEDYQEAHDKYTKFKGNYDTYKQSLINREWATMAIVQQGEPEQLQAAQKAVDTFIGGTSPLLANIDEIQERSIDELKGMLPATIDDEIKLDTVMKAKAMTKVISVSLPKYQDEAITRLTSSGITPDTLVSRNREELALDYKESNSTLTPPMTLEKAREDIAIAYEGAARQLRLLTRTQIEQTLFYHEEVITKSAKDLENIDKRVDRIGPEISVAVASLDKSLDIGSENQLSKIRTAVNNPEQKALLEKTTLIDAADNTFSLSEKALNEEERVIQWYRRLFPDHVNAPDRDNQLRAIVALFPPARLKAILNANPLTTESDYIRVTQQCLSQIRGSAQAA